MPYADIVTFTTHKTLRGPRGGCILSTAEHAKAIDKAVFPGWQGGPLEHVIAGKAVAFREAAHPSFKEYAHQIVTNASALAEALAGEGFRLVSGGTDNHLMVVDLRPFDAELTGKVAQTALDEAGITLNKNTIPDDPRSPFVTSGLRIGTPSVTTQGMAEPEMAEIAALIARALQRPRRPRTRWPRSRPRSPTLCARFPAYPDRRRCGRLSGRRRRRRLIGSPAVPTTGDYLLIGAVAGVVTFVVTPLVAALARWRGWLYEPNERTVHTAPMPAIGGMAMFVGFLVAFVDGPAARPLRPAVRPQLRAARASSLAATIIIAVGLFDDIKGLSAPAKVTGTVIAGLALVWFGVTMYYFRLPFLGVFVLSDDWIPLVTVLWLLGMTQAINLIDGLDGLAAGIVAIGACAFFLYSQRLADARPAAASRTSAR